MRWCTLLFVAVSSGLGCHPKSEAVWATDSIWMEPEPIGGDAVHGFQTWEFFGKRWVRKYNDRYFVCSALIEFSGAPTAATCEGCENAWAVEPELVETDCSAGVMDDQGFLSLSGVAIGEKGSDLEEGDPDPERSSGAFADYGIDGWETYGWAYPASPDPAETGWDGTQAFLFSPAWYWEL